MMPRPYDTCSMNPKIGIERIWLASLLSNDTLNPVISPTQKYASNVTENRSNIP